ncbi:MAG: ABC transporter ATP-binding protein [Tuberibacillus sp.]
MVAEAIIQLHALTKKYEDVTAVDRLTLDIMEGEIFGLLGPNGAGKSTTILMMLGLTEPTSGTVHVKGINSTRDPIRVKQKVGYLPDDVGFYDDRTGIGNLVLTAQLNGLSAKEAADRAKTLIKRVGLEMAGNKKTGTYSRGMRQRLGLADVLIKNPDIIILDEPTLGIDPEGVREFLALIKSLSRDEGLTVLLSSHHLHQVQQICDRVGLFVKGRLLAVGNVDELAKELFEKDPIIVQIKVVSNDKGLLSMLKGLDHVHDVKEINDLQFELHCDKDIAADIAREVVTQGYGLKELTKKHYGLDEIYHRYFEGGDIREKSLSKTH